MAPASLSSLTRWVSTLLEMSPQRALEKWMPPGSGLEPLQLFRVLARHPELSSRMRVTGAGLLGKGGVPARARELMIQRTSALCGAEYEWGVHAAAFGPAVGLDASDAAAVASGDFDRFGPRDVLVLAAR